TIVGDAGVAHVEAGAEGVGELDACALPYGHRAAEVLERGTTVRFTPAGAMLPVVLGSVEVEVVAVLAEEPQQVLALVLVVSGSVEAFDDAPHCEGAHHWLACRSARPALKRKLVIFSRVTRSTAALAAARPAASSASMSLSVSLRLEPMAASMASSRSVARFTLETPPPAMPTAAAIAAAGTPEPPCRT